MPIWPAIARLCSPHFNRWKTPGRSAHLVAADRAAAERGGSAQTGICSWNWSGTRPASTRTSDVVTMQTTLLVDQQTLTSLQVQQMSDAVQLVEALGGGWTRSQLPTPSQVTANPPTAETKIQQ